MRTGALSCPPRRLATPGTNVRRADMSGRVLVRHKASEQAALTGGVGRDPHFGGLPADPAQATPLSALDSPDRDVNPLPRPPLLQGADDGAIFARLVPVIGRYGYRVEVVDRTDFAGRQRGDIASPAARADQRRPVPAAAGQDGGTRSGPRRAAWAPAGAGPPERVRELQRRDLCLGAAAPAWDRLGHLQLPLHRQVRGGTPGRCPAAWLGAGPCARRCVPAGRLVIAQMPAAEAVA